MAATTDTVKTCLEVMMRHLDVPTIRKIVNDLQAVQDNESFMQTIDMLDEALRGQET